MRHLIRGMGALGDSLLSRWAILPWVELALAGGDEVWIETAWPELFGELNGRVRWLRPVDPIWRHAREHLASLATFGWSAGPEGGWDAVHDIWYGWLGEGETILAAMEACLPGPLPRRLPDGLGLPRLAEPWAPRDDRPLAVVRPVTVRTEWRNESRAPFPGYLVNIAARLMRTHRVVAIGDVRPPQELLVGEPLPCHDDFTHGELTVYEMLETLRLADLIVSGNGFSVPLALLTGTPHFVVLGGCGGRNAPEQLVDARQPYAERIEFAVPEPFCRCSERRHPCNKAIPDLWARWDIFFARHGSRSRSRSSTGSS